MRSGLLRYVNARLPVTLCHFIVWDFHKIVWFVEQYSRESARCPTSQKLCALIALNNRQVAEIVRLELAVRSKLCRFGQGVNKRRIGAILGGNALKRAIGSMRILRCFGNTTVNRIVTL